MDSVVHLENVRKTFRRGREAVEAVRGVSLSVDNGEFVAITGPSGSGKTTLLNLVGCVDRPDSGRVRVGGVDTTGLNERQLTRVRAEKIGFVFQQFFLLPTLTVKENVLLPRVFASRRDAAHADALIERVGLTARASHRPSELSGGEMQRAAVARALINQPQILLADEPTGSLDSETAKAIVELLLELNGDGLTIMLVTHNAELASVAQRLVQMRDGHLVSDGVRATAVAAPP